MMSQRKSISISVRRHFVDEFFFAHKELFGPNKKIIDIGGKKINKRSLFDISHYNPQVTYVNIEKKDAPDIVADGTNIPVADSSYDIAIMGEILEHVPDPKLLLAEAYRLLKPGGKLLATVPFLYPIHADPHDFGRYTESFWQLAVDSVGFSKMEIARQGNMFAVVALMVQHFFRAKNITWGPIQIPLVTFLMWLDSQTTSPLLKAWTTGYGIMLTK